MSRSRKDGARGGGHVDAQNTEFWSRRCPQVNGCTKDAWGKRVTHRFERRTIRKALRRWWLRLSEGTTNG